MKKQLPCNSCPKLVDQPRTSKRLYCDDCRKERELVSRRIANKKHREANKAEYSRKRKEFYRLNETTPEQRALRSEKNKVLKIALKQQIFEHYGQKCVCCGENHTEFLSIDHVEGGGNKHRKEVGNQVNLYRWIIKNQFPKSLRILCFNCNQSRGFFGYCPHEVEQSNVK